MIPSTPPPGNLSSDAAAPAGAAPASPRGIGQSDVIELLPLADIAPARINDRIYKPVALDDPGVVDLGRSIRHNGLLQPLDVTLDGVLVSGHRRRGGCQLAGLALVPVRRIHILSTDPRFEAYLVEFNRQRVKSVQEAIREEVVRTSPEAAHLALLANQRTEVQTSLRRAADANLRVLAAGPAARRSDISSSKWPMLDAAVAVVEQYRKYWPLTLRQIHYRLLTRSVLRNSRTGLAYTNTQDSYKDLSDLLTRARLAGAVPWEAMHDPTRPRTAWRQWGGAAEYLREQLDGFLAGYKRDLLQSQPSYVELVVEKITVQDIAERAAAAFHVPVGVGRGYTSATSLEETAGRYHASGKGQFILLIAGDLDPEGESISETWGSCLRHEHGVANLAVVKVGVNPDQVRRYGLAPLPVKERSSRAAAYKAAHGSRVYELESFEPDVLQGIVRDAIRGVLDGGLFEAERRREAEDARELIAIRNQLRGLLAGAEGGAA